MIIEFRFPKKWRNLENLGVRQALILNSQRRPTSNRTCTSTIPQKALQILISKMESYKRCCFHHCMPRKLRGNPMHWSCRREKGKCTIWAGKESLRSHSSEGQKASVKPVHWFHLGREIDQEFCSETVTRRIWEDLFLKATRITCSIRRDQTWRSKSFVSSPSTSASVNYKDKRKSKDWRYRSHNTNLLSPDENRFDYKKNCLRKKQFSEILKSEICTKWEKWRELKSNE